LPKDVSVLGQIADIVEVDPLYEMAVEAALGEQLRFYLVRDKGVVQKAFLQMKLAGTGRCGFVLPGFSTNHEPDRTFMEHTGVVGKAIDFVTAREPYKEVIQSLLVSTLIVKDLDTAFALWDKDGWHLVTPQGEVLTPGGLAKGGKEGGVLKLKRQIRELERLLSEKKLLLYDLTQSLEKLSNELSTIKRDINVTEKKIIYMEKERDSQTLKMEHYQEELARLKRRVTLFDVETEEILSSRNRLAGEQNKTQAQLTIEEQEKEALSQKMDTAQAQIDKQIEGLETQRKEITGLRLSLTAFDEKRKSFLRELKGLEGEKESTQKKTVHLKMEEQNTEKETVAKKAELQEREGGLKATTIEVSSLKTDFDRQQEEIELMRAEIDEVQKTAKTKSAVLEGLRKELSDWTVRKEKTRMKLEQVAERIRETYGVEIASYQAEQPSQDEAAQIVDLKRKLEEMGQVDPAVVEDYRREKERYDNLLGNQSDLVQSIDHLEAVIIKIDKTIRTRLTEAFHKMNEKFKEVFLRLFGSGRAELVLLGDDILEGGIEIIAQPPGKKPRSLLALSGGEKALTAISLLFAGFMIKPTPLCILDEVDAPLDESNTGKFSDMIRELSRKTQFILITHNKLTMEAADFIYGVTMEEAGSSSIVSLKLGGDNYESQKAQSAVA
jgi:chromosome segregation protein